MYDAPFSVCIFGAAFLFKHLENHSFNIFRQAERLIVGYCVASLRLGSFLTHRLLSSHGESRSTSQQCAAGVLQGALKITAQPAVPLAVQLEEL